MATRLELVEDVGRLQGLAARGERSDLREIRRLAAGLKRALEARRPPAPPRPRAAPVPVAAISGDLARISGLLEHLRVPRSRDAERVEAALRLISAVRRALEPRTADPVAVLDLPPALPLAGVLAGVVNDCPLSCPVTPELCVSRQIASEREVGKGEAVKRSSPAKRGRVASFVQCRTDMCSIGAKVRALHGDTPEAVEMAKGAPRCTDTSS